MKNLFQNNFQFLLKNNQFTININLATESSFQSNAIVETTQFTNAMKKRKIIMTIFSYYSKVFDTIDFSVLTKKMDILNFSKCLLCWINNFLTDTWHFLQFDSNVYNLSITNFGVAWGNILQLVLFILHVTGIRNILTSNTSVTPSFTGFLKWKISKHNPMSLKMSFTI